MYFTQDSALQTATSDPPPTTLTKFVPLCREDTFAETLLYVDVSRYYTWDASKKMWRRRKLGNIVEGTEVRECELIGRIYTVSPKQAECFFLRTLLHHVKGPQSFNDVKRYQGHIYPTFRDACLARGLLEDDEIHVHALQESTVSCTAKVIRQLFAIILIHCCPSNPYALWTQFADVMMEDIRHEHEQQDVTDQEFQNTALISIEDYVLKAGGGGGLTLDKYGLPTPQRGTVLIHSEYARKTSYSVGDQREFAISHIEQFTDDQLQVFNVIMNAINSQQGGLFFLDAPGGCGKTFLLKTLLADLRSKGQIAIATAGSGRRYSPSWRPNCPQYV